MSLRGWSGGYLRGLVGKVECQLSDFSSFLAGLGVTSQAVLAIIDTIVDTKPGLYGQLVLLRSPVTFTVKISEVLIAGAPKRTGLLWLLFHQSSGLILPL